MSSTLYTRLTVLLIALMAMAFGSCQSDSEPDDQAIYDFDIEWEVVDKGDYTSGDARELVEILEEETDEIFPAVTEREAIQYFNTFCQQLRYEFSVGYQRITILAKLIRNEGRKEIIRKTFYIRPEGTTVKGMEENAVVTE